MRQISFCVMFFLLLVILILDTSGHYITDDTDIAHSKLRERKQVESLDHERQVEAFDGDDYTRDDEPSFWDRVIKIAVKLFSRFVEWLNN
ncbi:hypothetical protein evm_014180 [Chilo suppressalis]|nr:hypothetical protein evm_014180 [Chilo suppressalis]